MRPIKNSKELRKAVAGGPHEFRVCLRGGLFSRKTIALCTDGRFHVENHIDGSVEKLTGRQLYSQSIIGEAMQKGALVTESPDDYYPSPLVDDLDYQP